MAKKKKRRLPIEQLRQAAKIANDLLIKRGLIHKDSFIEQLEKDRKEGKDVPVLPGLPSYLPHAHTIQAARMIMYDLLRMWIDDNKKTEAKLERIDEFFKYAIKVMKSVERGAEKDMRKMEELIKGMKDLPVIAEIFMPLRRRDTSKAMHKFFIDSFAVSVIVKSNESTSQFADWFLNEWTPSLYKFWLRHDVKKEDGKGKAQHIPTPAR